MGTPDVIYKLVAASAWRAAEALGRFTGSPVDIADGYIHLSTAEQVAATAAKHFSGVADLVLVAVSTAAVQSTLVWEPSRGGALFPHIYGDLPLTAVHSVTPVPLDATGRHLLPPDLA